MQLKNAAIMSIAALYLLITSGTFVCIVHCAGDYLFDKNKIAHQYQDKSHTDKEKRALNEKGKDCDEDKDCSCCNQHRSYAVDENIKVNIDSKVPAVPELVTQSDYQFASFYKVISFEESWSETHGPPGASGKAISIRFRSLLI